MNLKELAEAVQIAERVAKEAGELVFQAWRERPEIRLKNLNDLVTEWDLKSEQLLVKRLQELSDWPILAEEGGWLGESGHEPTASGEPSAGFYWVCDPIDGTTNFAHGHPIWCVSVGLMYGNSPVAGAVMAPCVQTCWTGHIGGMAQRNGQTVRVSSVAKLAEALVGTGFPPERQRAPENNFESFQVVKKAALAVRRCGSAAMDLCFVADGTYDAYWERRVHIWDLAAAAAIQLAAGGRLTALDGGEAQLTRGQVLATNGIIHEEFLELLAPTLV